MFLSFRASAHTGVAIRSPSSLRPAPLLSLRVSAHTGVAIRPPVPAPAGASPLFIFASGGHLSFNSERKVRKNATKTYGFGFPQRAMRCRKLASCSSRNRLSRVPLSVKRTVPPQLSATASLPLPVATAAASSSTAVPGHSPSHAAAPVRTVIPSQCSHWRGNPSLQSPLRGL